MKKYLVVWVDKENIKGVGVVEAIEQNVAEAVAANAWGVAEGMTRAGLWAMPLDGIQTGWGIPCGLPGPKQE